MNEGVASNQVKESSEKRALKLSRFLKEPRVKSYIKKNGETEKAHANSLTQTQTRVFL